MKVIINDVCNNNLKIGDVVRENGYTDDGYTGLVVEHGTGFNVVVLDYPNCPLYLNHSRSLAQDELDVQYSLIANGDDLVMDIKSKE